MILDNIVAAKSAAVDGAPTYCRPGTNGLLDYYCGGEGTFDLLEEVPVAAETTDEDYYFGARAGFCFYAFNLVAEELDDFGDYFGEDLAEVISN